MKHCRKQYNRFSFRLSLLGTQVDAGDSYETEHEAGIVCDLTKHYLRSVFGLDLEASLDPEEFSLEAYRRSVNLSDSLSVEKSLPAGIHTFINAHRDELNQIRENLPDRKPWEILRRSPEFSSNIALREWVLNCERAERDCEAFAAFNEKSFSARMSALTTRAFDILKPLAWAIELHDGVSHEKLVERKTRLLELQAHLQATSEHIKFLTAQFESESVTVFSALANLEAARPALV